MQKKKRQKIERLKFLMISEPDGSEKKYPTIPTILFVVIDSF